MQRNIYANSAAAVFFFLFGAGAVAARQEPPAAAPAPAAADAVTVPAGQKFIMRLETPLHTRTTRKGDRVEFTTAADVVVDGRVTIPDKSSVRAVVTKCKRAGRLFGRAEIQLKFEEIRLPDGSLLPVRASITRVGFDPVDAKEEENARIKGEQGAGGDVGAVARGGAQGAIIGILYGGPRGAMYGGATGAAVAAVGLLLRRGPDIDLPSTTMFEARFEQPLSIPASAVEQSLQIARAAAQAQASAGTVDAPPPAAPVPDAAEKPRPILRRPETRPDEGSAAPPAESTPPAAKPLPSQPSEANPVEAAAGVTLSVSVRMVQVDAVVRDRSGRMIDNLTKDDFRVYEDGVLQEIQGFSRDELPLAVALVVDRSGSVAPYIAELRRIAARALDHLKPGDEVALFSFARDVQRVEDLTADRGRIADALARIRPGGGTNIVDALYDSIAYLARVAPDRRHAIILISDNQETVQPRASEGETVRLALETEAVVYSIKTSGQWPLLALNLPSLLAGSGPVGKITRETGGEIIPAGSTTSLDAALGSVIARLRMRYSLGYYPTSAGQGGAFHAITVRLAEKHGKPNSDYFMYARRGYYSTTDRIR